MPTDITYDPGTNRSSTTNRMDPKLASQAARMASEVADCDITVTQVGAGEVKLTLQFKDARKRNYRGRLAFEIHQINGALGSAAVTSTGGINPVLVTGIALREIVSVTAYVCQTNASGLAVITIDQNSGTAQSFSIVCGHLLFNTGACTWT